MDASPCENLAAPGLRGAWNLVVVRQIFRRYFEMMPAVLRNGPYRFFFYSGDRDEPPHIHVERDDCEAKFWPDPIRLERGRGFARKEKSIIEENQNLFIGRLE